jgi:signal transduction histidine kinase
MKNNPSLKNKTKASSPAMNGPVLEDEINLQDTEKALLNILEDYNEEKARSLDIQRALLNILEDYTVEKGNMENTQRAVLNILEDYGVEKKNMENTQRAVLNILEDYGVEKANMENTQRAVLNILEDYGVEKANMENTQRAVLNILEDYGVEKTNMENTQRAILNILEDYGYEKEKVEIINNDLIAVNKELESFAYISSHDLQEPLRKIQAFSSRIQEEEYDNLSDKGKLYFERMQYSALRMQTLIRDLLAYSRTKTRERQFEVTDLNKIVEEIAEGFQEELDEKNGVIETPEQCEANIIPFQFRQLLQNLIGNALKFTQLGKPPHIIITSEIIKNNTQNNEIFLNGKDYCHITVSDNGIGFDPQYKERIFEIFQRLHTRTEYEGTGMGLAIVKKIVENHNGIITATGEINKGATFNIYLPF